LDWHPNIPSSRNAYMPSKSLSKAEILEGVGAELFEMCQSFTSDGVLSREEILELRRWLKQNRNVDLPAVGFLTATLDRIVADGHVTKAEADELHKAIESVLPPEFRREAIAARRQQQKELRDRERERTQAAKDAARVEKKAAKEAERLERERRQPINCARFLVAGTTFEGRQAHIEPLMAGEAVYLIRDRGNKHSRYAIEVRTKEGRQIGFVPEDEARELAADFEGTKHKASILKFYGYEKKIPLIDVEVFRFDAPVHGCVTEAEVPAFRKAGWFGSIFG
jgi:hypothetical protein